MGEFRENGEGVIWGKGGRGNREGSVGRGRGRGDG